MATATDLEIELLSWFDAGEGHALRINGDFYIVTPQVDRYTFAKETRGPDGLPTYDTVHTVWTGNGIFGKSCDCPAGRYRGRCRHLEATNSVLAGLW